MTEFLQTNSFASQAALDAQVAVDGRGSFAALGSFTVAGLSVTSGGGPSSLFRVGKYVGERNIPRDIRYQRRSTAELMRRVGQPVIVKHMWNPEDADIGLAQKSPNWQAAYGQVRNRDPISYGIGYTSIQNSPSEWIAPNGSITTASTSPGPDFVPAPMYRGYGPGYLTYIVEPDAAFDLYRHTPQGAFVRVQQAQALAAWFPEINDNDLIINVTLDNQGNVIDTGPRYVARETSPVSIRGTDRRGRQEYSADRGNARVINQTFTMDLLPNLSPLYQVEIDR